MKKIKNKNRDRSNEDKLNGWLLRDRTQTEWNDREKHVRPTRP